MIKGINQSMVNRYIMKRGEICNIIDNDSVDNDNVETITIDIYDLTEDTTNLYLYESQLSPIIDMVKKNRLCNMIKTAGLNSSTDFADDLSVTGIISCINNIQGHGINNSLDSFYWSLFVYLGSTNSTDTTFTNAFNFYFGSNNKYVKPSILTKPVKFIDEETDLTDAKMAKITLIYN